MAYTNEPTIPDFVTYEPDRYMPRAERKIQVWITGYVAGRKSAKRSL